MTTTYEFVVEELDFYPGCGDDPDIIDTSAFDTMTEARRFMAQPFDNPVRLCLRRDTGNEAEGLTDRFYAYPVNGRLPDRFESCTGAEDGPPVPSRFFVMDWR